MFVRMRTSLSPLPNNGTKVLLLLPPLSPNEKYIISPATIFAYKLFPSFITAMYPNPVPIPHLPKTATLPLEEKET